MLIAIALIMTISPLFFSLDLGQNLCFLSPVSVTLCFPFSLPCFILLFEPSILRICSMFFAKTWLQYAFSWAGTIFHSKKIGNSNKKL
ncbi:hypothetical protein CLU79DRAFT_760372 [Phycomyces nitens]|nr:hypothetical protein CLU79DRAFT_760372 [Phycomyces nitens]